MPLVVYEAVAAIVGAVDEGEAQKRQKFDEVNKQFREVRALVGAAEITFKSENDRVAEQVDEGRRVASDQLSRMEAKFADLRDSLVGRMDAVATEMEDNSAKDEALRKEVEGLVGNAKEQAASTKAALAETGEQIQAL